MPSRYERLREAATAEAEKVRALLSSDEPPVDLADLTEQLGLQVVYKELEPDTSGVLVRNDEHAVVGVNASHHPNRQRFTIAHEVGHFVLHGDQPSVFLDEHLVHFRADLTSGVHDPQETEANTFAAALLMPEEWLRRDLAERPIDASDEKAVAWLAERYGVSQQALTIRLTTLNLLAF